MVFTIGEGAAGRTVGEFLLQNGVSKRLLVKLKQTPEGLVLNGARARSTAVLSPGDTLAVTPPQDKAGAFGVPVLYEDEDLLVIEKPAGLACHRSGSHVSDTLEQAVPLRPLRAVGRLDKDTSGLMVLAKHQLAAARLHGRIEKTYFALVSGEMPPGEGKIELPLCRERPMEPRQIADPEGAPSRTEYRVIWSGEGRSAVLCRPVTGRMHQIRAHFASVGYPLLGDALYGGDRDRIRRQALHCLRISFVQPVEGSPMAFSSELPGDIRALLPPKAAAALSKALKSGEEPAF